jgi:hypothetical protein
MAEFADASDRREAMKTFLNEAPAAEVAEQTPVDEGVETVEELLETPAPRKEGTPAEEALPVGEEEVEEPEAAEEEVEADEEPGEETDEEREAREAAEAEELEADEVTPEQQVLLDHNEAFEGLVEALDTTDYPIDFGETPEQLAAGMQEVGLRLADAHAMYSIMDGKGADGVFERIKKFQGQEAHDFALNEVLKYAAKVGLIESADGTPAAAAKPGEASAAAPAETPREKALRLENEKLKKDAKTRDTTTQATAAADRQKKIFTSSMAEVERLGTEAKLDSETLMDFVVPYIIRQVGGKKDIINRCARGNFVDIQKFFDEAVNKISGKRVAMQNAKVQQRKVRDKVVPKRVAGEDKTRTAAVKPTFDLKTSDGRRAAAKAGLRVRPAE